MMCGGGCNTSSSTTAANPDAQAAYSDVVGKAQSVANTPYQPYGGQLVAGLNAQQNRSIGQLANAYGTAQPYIDQGNAGLGNVQQYLQGGSQSLAAAANYGNRSSDALGGITPYMGMVQGALGGAAGAFGQEQAGLGAAGNYFGQAGAGLGAAQGYFSQAAGLATPQSFDAAAVNQYMSPYLSSVVDATRANLNENNAQQRQGLVANAIGSGAYGGDRAGVAQAELARQQSLADGQTIAGLYNQGYSNAESQFNAVQGQRQQGASLLAGLGQATTQNALGYGQVGSAMTQNALGYGNVGSGYLGAASGYNTLAQDQGQIAQQYGTLGQLSLGAASGWNNLGTLQGTTGQAYGTLGSAAQANLISGASAGLQGGTLRQQNAQQQDTALYNQYMSGLSYPYQNVGFLSNIVQGIGSQEGNTQTTQGNALSSIAGLGTSAVGILGATGGFGSSGYLSGLGSSLSSAFSDARVKDDIASIGTTHDGQPIYRFRYKGDPKVQMGLMAQDVERRDPGAVGEVGGIKTVDYDRATRGAAAMGLGTPSPFSDGGAERLGLGLAARMARAGGGAVPGPGMPSPFLGGGTGPNLGTPSPVAQTPVGLGARPMFADGGAAPIPSAGLNVSPAGLLSGGDLNISPTGLTGGAATAHPVQSYQRPAVLTDGPASPQFASSSRAPAAGLGDVSSFNGSGGATGLGVASSYTGVSQDPGSSGFSPGAASGADGLSSGSPAAGGTSGRGFGGASQNAWMGVLAAGLGMMEGHSASALSNIGAGASKGLSTYLGLQQQDRNNSYRQDQLALENRRADQQAAYQQSSLGIQNRDVELRTKQLEAQIADQQRMAGIQSGQLANQTANTSSEIATRDQTRQIGRYQQFYVPGDGLYYRDLANPNAAPVRVGSEQSGGAAVDTGPISFNSPGGGAPPLQASPPPTAPSAPPPSGGVAVSGGGPGVGGVGATPFSPSRNALQRGAPAAATPPGADDASSYAARPQAGSAMTPARISPDWQPTTAVPRGYVPANSLNIAMSSDGGKSQAEIGQKQVEGLQTGAAKATNAQQQLYLMNAAVDALPKTGLIAPGAYGDERAKLANGLNTIASTFGAAPVIDPDRVANLQEVQKGAFRLGTQMITDTNGGREAGFILQNSVANVPSLNNSYLGFKRVAAGIDQANQYVIDKANFVSDYYAKYHHTDGADALFVRLNPWKNYAQRAIDTSTMPTARPAGVPQGSQYSMSAQMWRDPEGNLYGRDGQAVRR